MLTSPNVCAFIPTPIPIRIIYVTLVSMFSVQTAPIETNDILIDSDFHGYDPCQRWAPVIDQVFSCDLY